MLVRLSLSAVTGEVADTPPDTAGNLYKATRL
jgi:hypothetical protein